MIGAPLLIIHYSFLANFKSNNNAERRISYGRILSNEIMADIVETPLNRIDTT